MDSSFISFPITDFERTKQQVLDWINRFSTCCLLDNHQYQFNHHTYECIAAAGVTDCIEAQAGSALAQLQQFQQQHHGWLFGHLAYDLKDEIIGTVSTHPDQIGFPDLFFFVPETVLLLNKNELCIAAGDPANAANVFTAITSMPLLQPSVVKNKIEFQSRFSKQSYIQTVEQLQRHIQRGDCYEINFCQEFFAENVQLDPVQVYRSLSAVSPAPFAAFYKINHRYLFCASPERYLKKEGDVLISQPMKGTASRNVASTALDNTNKENLYNSAKDRSENVMVVDLVRNDLSKLCIAGSVRVDELFGIHSFPQVHQMVSTISGRLRPDVSFADIINETFPMGSMTGAPKKKVVELIEQYEQTRRGLFSGAVGYVQPGGNLDLNVVIRSILYNAQTGYCSYQAGSGITINSTPLNEYEECLLKVAAIKNVFA